MSVNGITSNQTAAYNYSSTGKVNEKPAAENTSATTAADTGVVYEPSRKRLPIPSRRPILPIPI